MVFCDYCQKVYEGRGWELLVSAKFFHTNRYIYYIGTIFKNSIGTDNIF